MEKKLNNFKNDMINQYMEVIKKRALEQNIPDLMEYVNSNPKLAVCIFGFGMEYIYGLLKSSKKTN